MKKFLIITIIFLFPFIVKAVDSFPSFPMSFYGRATLNSVSLPTGTKIQAYNNGVLKGEITIEEDGIYGYDNPIKNKLVTSEYSGTLQFKYLPEDSVVALTGDNSVGYTGGFVSGKTEELNLSFIKNSVQLNNANSETAVTSADVATTTILIAQELTNPKINLSSLMSTTTTSSLVITPSSLDIKATTSLGLVLMNIPSDTNISSTEHWNGVINAPTIKANDSVSVTADSGKTATVQSVVEVGFDDIKLTFDKAVRLLIPGQAGKDAGYYRSSTFTKISNICAADNQTAGDALVAEGDCKKDVGADLVIWTKHFTKFASYTQTTNTTNNGGGGGGGGGGSPAPASPAPAPTATSTPAATSTSILAPQVLEKKVVSQTLTQLEQILADSYAVYSENIDMILVNAKTVRSQSAEKITADKYLSNLTHNENNFLPVDANRLNFFITYGTVGTKILGVGERAGVLGSYKSAFGKLPKTETEWQDAIKIANGRWPSERSTAAETKAKLSFKKIYARDAKMDNANDNAAVTVMAYGLRPSQRNTNSEKVAIISFKYIYKRAPVTAIDWDMVRAIAYSGAKR
ncbi:MAG: hypothetical protein WCL13_01795 [bacterium]